MSRQPVRAIARISAGLSALLAMGLILTGLTANVGYTSSTTSAAVGWAQGKNGQNIYNTWCLTFVHDAYLYGAGIDIGNADSAAAYWFDHPSLQHLSDANPPQGALVFWNATPSNKAGHVALGLGGDTVISSGEEQFSTTHTFSIRARNAAGYPYLGWMMPPGVSGDMPSQPAGGGTGNGGSIIRGLGSSRCLDVAGGGVANGSTLQLYDCIGNSQQSWVSTNGTLEVYGNYHKCLDADTSHQGANGTTVQIWDCTSRSNQKWSAQANGTLRNDAYGRCLDAAGFGVANGTRLQLWDCAGGSNQVWRGIASPNGGARVQGIGSGRCLDVVDGSISPGATLQLWDCSAVAQQQWLLDGTQLRVFGDKCLDVTGAGTANGTKVQIWYCSGAAQQQWDVLPSGAIVSRQSGKCLDAIGMGISNGTKLQIWDCNLTSNQLWKRI